MTPSVDVIIVSYNTRRELAGCLESVHAHPPAGLGRVVVVDNASFDGSPVYVRQTWPTVHLHALEKNVGFGAANNIAIRESKADFVLLLNSDTVVPPGALDKLIGRLTATSASAAGPRLVDANGRVEVSFGSMLTPWAEAVQRRRVRLSRRDDPSARRRIAALTSREREVDWISGACFLADRRAVVEAGLFDERYFMYEEDVDLCAALRARGGRILFTPQAEVVHVGGRSAGARPDGVRAIYHRSHLEFYKKHAPQWVPLLRIWQRLGR